ncbi:Mitochondrial pyruvate carrier 3 [Escovopsis weberi]|uniref:Mitochondrial pyruvate carrier n=1 Tax=Escovopsis weberi TaxID=150374 RepID=A0A0M9VVE4_ESCWE|nr:Mitochondrial pyruvate carrier 3 [Escovopsis weberi]
MSATNSILRAARPAFRQAFSKPASPFPSRSFNQSQFFKQNDSSRRWQSTASDASQSWFKRAWESEVGIKTVHFWAPVMKWALVIAGISDFARPVEKLSFTQNFALTCTGFIWTRWCLIIKPKNYLLAAVNFFLGLVGITQISRIALADSSKKSETPAATTA